MRIGIIGAGNIGRNCAVQLLAGGHDVTLSFTRNSDDLAERTRELGDGALSGTPSDAVAFGDAIILAVPWSVVDVALQQAGPLDSKIVIDTTNQFADGGIADLNGITAARHNANRMLGARYTKSFNTITAGYQRQAAGRVGSDRLVQWICGDDVGAKHIVAGLVTDAGYAPVDLGGLDTCAVMEAPRRPGAVYGEEYHATDAQAVVAAVRSGAPIPPTPIYP